MTEDEAYQLSAGRGMDLEIATKVMGWKQDPTRCPRCNWPYRDDIGCKPGDCSVRPLPDDAPPHYSTDIAAAWSVAEKLHERWGNFKLIAGLEWHCCQATPESWRTGCSGDTPMLAICRAALLEFAG